MSAKSILLSAAKRIDIGKETYSCLAISCPPSWQFRYRYAEIMSPTGFSFLSTDDIRAAEDDYHRVTAKKFRVLLLLMFRVAYDDLKEIP